MEQKLGLRSINEMKYRKIDHIGKNHWMGFDDLLDMSRGLGTAPYDFGAASTA